MFEDKKERFERMKETLEEFTEHMYLVNDGMMQFQRDLGMLAKELNVIKSYMEIVVKVLDKQGIISKEDVKELATENVNKKVEAIKKNMKDYEKNIKKETESMQHLITKFKASIGSWFDEDGNPIAKA
tara:strand:- start:103 stop:486 length:384 start_codon:yes stop_codon:yes gene_type:complete